MTPEAAPIPQSTEPRELHQAQIVVGIPAGAGEKGRELVAAAVSASLERLFPSHLASVFFLERQHGHGEVEAVPAAGRPSGSDPAAPAIAGADRPSPVAGGFLGPASALPALLREAQRLDAPMCALVAPEAHEGGEWLRLLVAPILDEGYDYVCPSYVRGKLEGAINNGIVYPLTRALFGKRLRQPLGGELAVSRHLADELLADEEWQTDPVHAGADVWLVTKALTRGLRVCQSFLGPRPEEHSDRSPLDLSETLARVAGLLFHEMERHAAVWQRITGSEPVRTFGVAGIRDGEPHSVNVSRMIDAFQLGHQDLRELWGTVLPPATLLSVKRITRQGASSFRVADELWARIVYDFALGYHMRLMERAMMLRSMTPLYLGWLAGFVNEVRDLDGPQTEERIERLCLAFEEAKPYLVSRWRWPDRFNP